MVAMLDSQNQKLIINELIEMHEQNITESDSSHPIALEMRMTRQTSNLFPVKQIVYIFV